MSVVPANITPFIQSQLPAFYASDGPLFIMFLEAYYKWLGTRVDRQVMANRDIDTATDAFLTNFNNTYLPDVNLGTVVNKRLLIKNIMDVYRSKGTARGISLFLKLLYGVDASVRYPGDNVFRTSDSKWVQPRFLQVTSSTLTSSFVGKIITGVVSGAKAYAVSTVNRKTPTDTLTVINISDIQGQFVIGEPIKITNVASNSPVIIGSPAIGIIFDKSLTPPSQTTNTLVDRSISILLDRSGNVLFGRDNVNALTLTDRAGIPLMDRTNNYVGGRDTSTSANIYSTNGGYGFTTGMTLSFNNATGDFGSALVLAVDVNGTITKVSIIDSGIGFRDGDLVNLRYNGSIVAIMVVQLAAIGTQAGYFNGPVLDNSYIQDNNYYQDFSYEVVTSIPFDKYSSALKSVMHPAGNKAFGSVALNGYIDYLTTGSSSSSQSSVQIPSSRFNLATNSQYIPVLF